MAPDKTIHPMCYVTQHDLDRHTIRLREGMNKYGQGEGAVLFEGEYTPGYMTQHFGAALYHGYPVTCVIEHREDGSTCVLAHLHK